MQNERDELAEAMANVAASIDILTHEFRRLAMLLNRAGLAAQDLADSAKKYTETGSLRVVRQDEAREQ